ncbi:MAG: hypothetical protein KKD38_04705 [Candidatus Delongbacteria bacterium]|nr:hypothetical protein [Candidatus Delongbacteria bacterium]MCG2761290.1 hypothetical protein [Candidatus Delongbacteria bacterium]
MDTILKNAAFVIMIIHSIINAYTFSPSVAAMSPGGYNSSFLYTIANPEERAIPVEITIHEFKKDIYGKSITGNEDYEDFIVFPAQFILKKNEMKMVQVRWIGDPGIQIEKTYTVRCRELEIPLEKKEPNTIKISVSVNVLIGYDARLYVTPSKGEPEIVIDSIKTSTDENGKNEIIITCLNKGNVHGKLRGYSFIIRPGSDKKQFPEFEPIILDRYAVPGMAEAILAKSSRKFIIPWPEKLPQGQINIELVKNVENVKYIK